jgi:putative thiamine transport system permease protein
MATPLRYALILLLWAIMAAVYLPLVPAAFSLIAPALSLPHWLALFADPQLPQALLATLVSTGLAAGGALIIALLAILTLWPGAGWARLSTRLPWLLAIPHVAFATSVLLVFAEGGKIWQWLPFLSPQPDRYGIGLGVTLAVKESAFLLWILSALLSEKQLSQQVIVLDSLGYSRLQCLNWLVLPAIGPALGKAMLAIVAWSLSVVDVAIVLGPGNPPTLAVLSWQWLSQGDVEQQAKGALASLLLVLLLLIIALVSYLLWRAWRRTIPAVNGERLHFSPITIARPLVQILPVNGVVCALVLALIASYSSLNHEALSNSLQLGLLSSVLALLILFVWLEWGPQTGHRWWRRQHAGSPAATEDGCLVAPSLHRAIK